MGNCRNSRATPSPSGSHFRLTASSGHCPNRTSAVSNLTPPQAAPRTAATINQRPSPPKPKAAPTPNSAVTTAVTSRDWTTIRNSSRRIAQFWEIRFRVATRAATGSSQTKPPIRANTPATSRSKITETKHIPNMANVSHQATRKRFSASACSWGMANAESYRNANPALITPARAENSATTPKTSGP